MVEMGRCILGIVYYVEWDDVCKGFWDIGRELC